jgi:anti-sigma factor RsiW
MTCREFQQLFLALAFDDLAAEQRGRAHAHLRQCPPCAHQWAGYQQVIALARQLTDTPIPAEVSERVRAALARREQENRDEGERPQAE